MRRIAYLKPHPVPPSTMAATRMAPAMELIIRLVALGPVKGLWGKRHEFLHSLIVNNMELNKDDFTWNRKHHHKFTITVK